jgi:hypothetical protein
MVPLHTQGGGCASSIRVELNLYGADSQVRLHCAQTDALPACGCAVVSAWDATFCVVLGVARHLLEFAVRPKVVSEVADVPSRHDKVLVPHLQYAQWSE